MDAVRFRLRNIITLLLVFIFAPVSVASAMPLVWCSTPSGHQAVELTHRSTQHHHSTDHAADTHVEADGCRDRQLMDASKLAHVDLDGIVPFSERAVLPLPELQIELAAAQNPRLSNHPPAPPDPIRAALRSVILLI